MLFENLNVLAFSTLFTDLPVDNQSNLLSLIAMLLFSHPMQKNLYYVPHH